MGVYKKVYKSKCFEQTGKGLIGVRWIDVNKQDEENPLYRSRLVAKRISVTTRIPTFILRLHLWSYSE